MIRIEPASTCDHADILTLNDAAIPAVNRIDAGELDRLHAQAEQLLVAKAGDMLAGFLLVLNESADYGSPNYRYFRARHDRFAYVDRIVVAEGFRGQGIGARLYHALMDTLHDVPRITCEVNVKPPNPGSLAFHRTLGFQVVGEQDTEGGAKRVALMVLERDATA